MILQDDNLLLENVRLSYPHLKTPSASTAGGALKYRANFLMDPAGIAAQELTQLITAVAEKKWPGESTVVLTAISADRRSRCYGKGEENLNKKTGQPSEGYPGQLYLSSLSDANPNLFDETNNPIDVMALGGRFVGGDWVDAHVRIWAQDNSNGRGIRCELVGVRFRSVGEHFGADRMESADVFGAPAPQQAAAAAPAAMPGAPAQPAAAPAVAPAAPGVDLFG